MDHRTRRLAALFVPLLGTMLAPSFAAAVPVAFAPQPSPGTGPGPFAVAIANLNNDTIPDLAVANFDGNSVSVLIGLGNGAYAPKVDYATGSRPTSVAVGDFDADGDADLAVVNFFAQTISVLPNNGNGTFAARTDVSAGQSPYVAVVADLNGDAFPDIAVTNNVVSGTGGVSVLLNQGDGTIAPGVSIPTGGSPIAIAAADINADTKPDLLFTDSIGNKLSVLVNLGGAAFANRVDYSTGILPIWVSVADLNADSKPDIAVTNTSGDSVSVFVNLGNSAYAAGVEYTTSSQPYSVAIADVDADGRPDLIALNNATNGTVSIFQGRGNATFAPRVDYPIGMFPKALAVADLNADTKPDIVAANEGSNSVGVLLNQITPVAFVRAGLTTGNNDGTSWPNAYRELRTALTDLQSAPWVRELWVATGIYTPAPPNGPRSASFNLRSNLAIYGGFAGNETSLSQRNITQNPTVLSGDLNSNDESDPGRGDNAMQVIRAIGVSGAVVDGVRVTAGFANPSVPGPNAHIGAGALVQNATVRFEECTFADNHAPGIAGSADASGGAVYAYGIGAASFVGCRFVGNSADYGGAVGLDDGPHVVRDCEFEGNVASQGAGSAMVLETGASADIIGATFLRNLGPNGAFYALNSNAVSLINCQFLGNVGTTSTGAAQFSRPSPGLVANCLFVGNAVDDGAGGAIGGLAIYSGSTTLVNSTFVANRSGPGLGAVHIDLREGGSLSIRNSVLWENTAGGIASAIAQISPAGAPEINVSNSIVQFWAGGYPGVGTIGTDPAFTGPMPAPNVGGWGNSDDFYGNLRLTQGSPALDSGATLELPADIADINNNGITSELLPLDLDGSPRIQNNTVDRGCYEGFRCPICPNDRQWFSALSGTWSDDPRWSFSSPTPCTYALIDAAGEPYTINFNNADSARGLLHPRNTVTLSAPAISDTLTLRPPGFGVSCPSGVPQTFRPALLVSGAILDNPTLNITSGTVSASSGFIAEAYGEVGAINVIGPSAKLTFASGTCSIGEQGDGALAVLEGATAAAGFFFVGQGDIDSEPDGVFDLHGSILVDGPGSTLKPKFSLNITHGTVTVRNQGLIDCGTTGTVFVLPGSSLTGDGQIIGRVVNFGDVGPEDTGARTTAARGTFQPKSLTITSPLGGSTSAYEQLGNDPKDGPRTGTLRLRAAGSGGVILADSIVVNGTAKIAGTLIVEPVGAFSPGTSAPAVPLLNAGTVDGRFDLAVFPGIAGDRFLRLDYTGALGERGGGVSVSVAPLSSNIDLDPPSTANVGGIPTDIVAADFDNDPSHDLDLALTVPDASNPTTAPGTVVILKNAGNTGPGGAWAGFTGGQLTFNVGINPRGLAWGDFNADGVPDLAVANAGSNSLTVLRNLNNGTGAMTTSQTVAVGTSPVAVVTGVFRDSSTAIDVAVANQGSNSITVLNNTAGTLATSATLAAGESPSDITAARLDSGSSTLDLAVANRDDSTVTIYYRPPGGTFPTIPSRVLPVSVNPANVEPGGLDNPKDINDLAVTSSGGGTTNILLNNDLPGASAGFQPKADLPSGSNPEALTLGDLDNDGDPDLSVVTTVDAQRVVRVFRNDSQDLGGGQFQAAFAPFGDAYAGTGPRLVIAGDVNLDGRDDLIAVNDQTVTFQTVSEGPPQRALVQQPNVSTSLSLPPNVPAPCPGDLAPSIGDRLVNTADLTTFLAQFGRNCSEVSGRCGDFNADGFVNTTDLVALLSYFGQPCP